MENEIRSSRKKRNLKSFIFKVVIVLSVIMLVLLLSLSNQTKEELPLYAKDKFTPVYHAGNSNEQTDKIALIKIEGVISNSGEKWDSIANANSIADQLYVAENDPSVKAIILYIDSPGGEITAVEKIYHHLREAKKKGKKTVALMNSIAASGGYYVAAGCDKIIAGKLTITGSIGVIVNSLKYYNLLDKIGVQSEVFKTGEFKDFLNPARPSSLKEKELVKNMLNESYEEFVHVVSDGRINRNKVLTEEYIKKSIIGDGRIFSGQEALHLGLIDMLGYYSDAVDEAIKLAGLNKKNVQIIRYEGKIGISDLFNRFLYKKFSINMELLGLSRNTHIEPGHLYFLSPGTLQ